MVAPVTEIRAERDPDVCLGPVPVEHAAVDDGATTVELEREQRSILVLRRGQSRQPLEISEVSRGQQGHQRAGARNRSVGDEVLVSEFDDSGVPMLRSSSNREVCGMSVGLGSIFQLVTPSSLRA